MSQTYVENYSSSLTTQTTAATATTGTMKKSKSPPLTPLSSRCSQADQSSVTKSDLKPEPDLPLDLCLPPSTAKPMSVKQESPSASRSHSPSIPDVKPPVKEEDYGSPMLDDTTPASGSSSKGPSPPATTAAGSSSSRKAAASAPQLIGHLPVAREEALASFTEMPDNWYQYKSLGRSRELLESMTCECLFDPDSDHPEVACGHSSDCINRLTQVECLPGDCRCGDYCQNQRFQKKEYASIEIVKTEMKGYGLRIEGDIQKDTFIYEYVGDVVNNQSFKKRMREYANEGIQHFYFMMLQKDEFIDATKNGGIGRFANHSCNPNCYVAKWTVGTTVRMGIFAKRNIKKHEELTFNYNVDRYGHQAQTCYCGEPNCVGFIGGKTQTDVSTMDDLYLDALGITDDADVAALKGNKKKKGKKIDDPDFMPQMKPIVEKEVPKVVQALRQVQSKKVLSKLLTRIKITEDGASLRQIMRLRGFSIMKNILEDYAEDLDVIALALQSMISWPLVARNKVEDSQIMAPVEKFTESADETVKNCATKLKDYWNTLEMSYRIPKRIAPEEPEPPKDVIDIYAQPKRSRFIDADDDGNKIVVKQQRKKRSMGWYPRPATPPPEETPPMEGAPSWIEERLEKQKKNNEAVNSIIAQVAEEQAAAEAVAAERARLAAEEAKVEAERQKKSKDKDKDKDRKKSSQSSAEREANKEKRLQKLVGAIVVKCMSKYAKSLEHEMFKKYAKELTEKIAEREKKTSAYKEGKLDSLSEEKITKIKKYAKEYITTKILRKIGKSGQHRPRPSITPGAPSNSDGTPNSADLPSTMAELDVDEDMQTDSDDENGVAMDIGDDDGWGPVAPKPPSMEVDVPNGKHDIVSDPRQRPPKVIGS
ncbi:histone-lysine n-methyltransferase [Moniliophthora roreri MCA 2997]|uniref:Histone-lysine N-methyltransferase, H3 lysine-36 specific n=1 Tax=Moniliophthora roreri (strain MCA 2997) TaxID=1381753 RepID=V2XC11_MONRO|nr:histone-lysine n-methyltransferase [Moniliophthora roreri MCA 2997]